MISRSENAASVRRRRFCLCGRSSMVWRGAWRDATARQRQHARPTCRRQACRRQRTVIARGRHALVTRGAARSRQRRRRFCLCGRSSMVCAGPGETRRHVSDSTREPPVGDKRVGDNARSSLVVVMPWSRAALRDPCTGRHPAAPIAMQLRMQCVGDASSKVALQSSTSTCAAPRRVPFFELCR
jgi:hypothetical protein